MRTAALLLLVASTAHADKYDPDAWAPRVSAGAAIGYRTGDLADLSTSGPNLTLEAELKLRPSLFLAASLDYAPTTGHDERLARDLDIATTSTQLAVRNPLMSFGDNPHELGGEMFVIAGVAREYLRWSTGGLARNALVFGLGTTLVVPHRELTKHVRAGFRMFLARAPQPAKSPAGCDGPCDTPTRTAPYDLSLLVEVSCHLGR